MIGFDEAIERLQAVARPGDRLKVKLRNAAGRVLAEPVRAAIRAPAANVSTMDGYAVRDADLSQLPARLRVVGEARPGTPPGAPLAPGTCLRIFTGGPVPAVADRVVVQEVVRAEGGEAVFGQAPGPGRFIRPAGSDFEAGDVLVPAGRLLSPGALVAAAAGDAAEVAIFAKPLVSLITTGDELAEPGGARARPGSVPDSISIALAALALAWGAELGVQERMGDDVGQLRELAVRLVRDPQLIVVSGGASVGAHDHARAMFGDGLELVFSKVAMKPGKPVWLGRAGEALVLGLPGNPTSALVTARLFLAPLLAGLAGRGPADALAWREAVLAEPLGPTGDRETFSRGFMERGAVRLLPNQDSGAQRTLADATLLARRPIGAPGFAAGDTIQVLDL